MSKLNHYYVSASSERSASMLIQEVSKNNTIEGWTYVPLGNSYVRTEILQPLIEEGVRRDQLIGYFANTELLTLTGSI